MASRKRTGFTVIEVIVTLAIMAVAMAAVVVTTKGRIQDKEAEALVATLEAFRVAIVNFRAHVGAWPHTTRQLVFVPDAPTTPHVNDDNVCESSFTSAQLLAWRGPYLTRLLTAEGLQVGNSVVERRFAREPATTSIAGNLVITVNQVDEVVAQEVDEQIDGKPSDFASGSVRYTLATSVLTYRMRIGGC